MYQLNIFGFRRNLRIQFPREPWHSHKKPISILQGFLYVQMRKSLYTCSLFIKLGFRIKVIAGCFSDFLNVTTILSPQFCCNLQTERLLCSSVLVTLSKDALERSIIFHDLFYLKVSKRGGKSHLKQAF